MGRNPKDAQPPIHNRLAVLRAERGLSRQQLSDADRRQLPDDRLPRARRLQPEPRPRVSPGRVLRPADRGDLRPRAVRPDVPPSSSERRRGEHDGRRPRHQPPGPTSHGATPSRRMSRASRRRWTLAYALLLVLLAPTPSTTRSRRADSGELPLDPRRRRRSSSSACCGAARAGSRRSTIPTSTSATSWRATAPTGSPSRCSLLVVLAALALLALSVPDTRELRAPTACPGATATAGSSGPQALVGARAVDRAVGAVPADGRAGVARARRDRAGDRRRHAARAAARRAARRSRSPAAIAISVAAESDVGPAVRRRARDARRRSRGAQPVSR